MECCHPAVDPCGTGSQGVCPTDDQFHQAESDIYFYLLCTADPNRPEHLERARRFAGLYMNEDPEALNYDPRHKIIRSPHNGSDGPDLSVSEGHSYAYSPAWRDTAYLTTTFPVSLKLKT